VKYKDLRGMKSKVDISRRVPYTYFEGGVIVGVRGT
jgi:hypothetical protein